MSKFRFAIVIVLLSLLGAASTATSAAAADSRAMYKNAQHLLDGKRLVYYYRNGWGIDMEFNAGEVKYVWIAGPRKGFGNHNIPYQSRKIGDGLYFVNWLEAEKPDFVTLVFNFKKKTVYSSVITRFGTEKQAVHFDSGNIQKVDKVH